MCSVLFLFTFIFTKLLFCLFLYNCSVNDRFSKHIQIISSKNYTYFMMNSTIDSDMKSKASTLYLNLRLILSIEVLYLIRFERTLDINFILFVVIFTSKLSFYAIRNMKSSAMLRMLLITALLSTNIIDGHRLHHKSHGHRRRQEIDFPESCVAALATGSWVGCALQLGQIIWSLHTWSDDQPLTICGIDCTGNLKGRVSKLEWVWDGKFQCETQAPGIVGEGSGLKSRQGAMEKAIEQFIVAAIAAGKLKAEDFKC
jgi:hypothetical protein